MTADIRWQQRFSNYCKALTQLEAFLNPPGLNEREQQGLVKAFEYTFELAWNTLRDLLLRGQRHFWAHATPCAKPFGLA